MAKMKKKQLLGLFHIKFAFIKKNPYIGLRRYNKAHCKIGRHFCPILCFEMSIGVDRAWPDPNYRSGASDFSRAFSSSKLEIFK